MEKSDEGRVTSDEPIAEQPKGGGEKEIEVNGQRAEHDENSSLRRGSVKRLDSGVMGQFGDERGVGCELVRALSEADKALYW